MLRQEQFIVSILDFADFGDEAVAQLGHGLDEAVSGFALAEGLAQHGDVVGEVVLFDEGIRPDGPQKFFSFQESATALNKQEKCVKSLGWERDRLPLAKEQMVGGVQLERAELE